MRYRKTAAGQAVVADRKNPLEHKLRSLLVVINPALAEPMIDQMVAALHLPGDAVQGLMRQGLIEAVPEAAPLAAAPAAPGAAPGPAPAPAGVELSSAEFERFRSAVGLISEITARHLGWRAFTFQLKIERAATLDDIKPLANELKELLRKVKKESEAAAELSTLDLLLS